MAPRFLTSRRVVLSIGFGGLLAIISLMAWKTSRVISAIEPQSAQLRATVRVQTEFLDSIRFGLAESASEIRDYLLDRDARAAELRRAQLQELHRSMDRAVEGFGPQVPQDERLLWEQLKDGIAAYWKAIEPAFRWSADRRQNLADAFLREEVIPRHREIVSLAATVARVNDRNFQRNERQIAGVFAQFRKEMAVSALLSVVLGGILAFVTIGRILDLERASEEHLNAVAQARVEMQRLSQRLVSAQEEERRRVARELHDEVGQAISAVLVEIGRLESHLPAGRPEDLAGLAVAHQLADRAVAQVRDMALLLRPSMLDDLGLIPALKWQAREVGRRTGIKVKVAAEDAADQLPDEYRTCIYRVAQEALNNAARHGKAASVRIDVKREGEQVRVSIQDDGIGFDPSQERGMGILGMEERVKNLGGVFRIDSKKDGGSIVSFLLPVARPLAGGVGA